MARKVMAQGPGFDYGLKSNSAGARMSNGLTGSDDWRNWARLAALGVIWGGSFLLVSVAVKGMGPMSVAAGRLTVAALILTPLAFLIAGGMPKGRKIWIFALGAAIFSNALPFTLLSWAQQTITSGVAGVYMAALPLVVLPLSHYLVPGETLNRRKVIGFLIGFLGVLVLLGAETLSALTGAAENSREALANLACFGASCCYAIGSVTMKRAPKTHPVAFGAASMLLAAVMIGPLAWFVEAPDFAAITTGSLSAVLVLGVLPTALALLIMLKILETAGPPFLSLVNYQVPVWALLFGALFLNEAIAPRLYGALLLIMVGVAVTQNLWRRIRRAKAPDAVAGKSSAQAPESTR